MSYQIIFNGTIVYDGDNKGLAHMIATAFAHAYDVRGWSRGRLSLVVDLNSTMKNAVGTLGHDAIAIVNDFFSHY